MNRDPVCGMEVNTNTAHKSEFQGQTYYFCSLECKLAFDSNPQEYIAQARAAGNRS